MAEYKTTKKLKPEIAAYLAGLIDGEGTVTLSRRHANEHRQLVISIANTERAMLEYVLEQIGAGKITGKRTVSAAHTASYCYSISNRQALSLLEQISPYLRTHKKLRSALILRNYKDLIPRNGKYTAALLARRTSFEQALFAITAKNVGN